MCQSEKEDKIKIEQEENKEHRNKRKVLCILYGHRLETQVLLLFCSWDA